MKHRTVLIRNFLLLFVLLPFCSSSQEKLDLFIWAGQSNAQGWMGDAAYYPEEGKELDESILFNWTFVDNENSGGKWGMMQAQTGRFPKGHFGPEVSFCRELKKAGYNPAIFKYTKGATGLARDWKAPGKGGIYDRMTEDLKSAIKKLEKQGFKVTLRGFIWIQGESDAGNENTARDYYLNLKRMIHDLRQNVLNEPNLKIILGVDEQHPFVKEHPVVLKAQQKLASEDTNIIFTSMVGLPKADATHLTPAGLVEHGKRIFKTYLKSLSDSLAKNLNHLPIETPRLAAVIWMPAQLLGQESVVSAKVTTYDSIPLLNAEVKARGMGMSDIQNIRVKGSTASIYCYRGGNGVIEVDTKRGKFK